MIDLEKVEEYAFRMHKDITQKYGKYEYSYHLEGVVSVLKEFKKDPSSALIATAYLHDILEDTQGTEEEIRIVAGEDCLDLVKRLTDKDGKNRKERHLNTYYLIRENEDAVIIKLSDRIFNIRECIKSDLNKARMYLKENDSFKFALYDPRMINILCFWKEYDKLIQDIKERIK